MFSPSRILGTLSGLAVLACLLACGAMQQASLKQKRRNDLAQIGIAVHNYAATNQDLFPPDEQTFVKWLQQGDPSVAALVQSGQYTVVYAPGVRISGVPEGTSNVVLGYENVPSPGGRLVLMADGSVQQTSEAEFNAKPKLKGKK